MYGSINVIGNSANPNLSKPLSATFLQEIQKTRNLDIAVGYISTPSLEYLQEIIATHPDMSVRLVCGMHAREGMTEKQYTRATELDDLLTHQSRGGLFVTPRVSYHGKVYIFDKNAQTAAYVGSSNLNGILPNYSLTSETGLYLSDCEQLIRAYWETMIWPLTAPLKEVDIPIIPDARSPMYEVDEAHPVSTSYVAHVMMSPARYTFELPLKTHAKSSLNAHMGGGGQRKNKTSGLARNWYEGELIVGAKDRAEGYPAPGTTFKVITDDGWSFECKISGQGGKNLRSRGKLSTFGTWIKSRLIESDALEFGDLATPETIEKFGRDTLTMRYHPKFDIWSFDLSRIDQQN